jgi:hypothetical protein
MQKVRGNWTKVGAICAVFCFYAGVRYTALPEELRFPYGVDCGLPTSQQTSVVAFWVALDLFSVAFVIWSIVRRRHVLQAVAIMFCAFLGAYILAIALDRQIPFF